MSSKKSFRYGGVRVFIKKEFAPKVCEAFEEPVVVTSRKHFKEECRKRGHDPEDCDIFPGDKESWNRHIKERRRKHG